VTINPDELVVVGKVTTVYGIKGWVKVHSFTEPMDNIFGYENCYIERNGQWQSVVLEGGKRHGKGLISRIKGVPTREEARLYGQCNIAIPASDMTELEDGEFYWHQLEGLKVLTTAGEDGQEQLLGKVHHLMETGANDVLVVRKCQGSIDKRERLIPYVPEQFVQDIDLTAGEIRVNWDPEF
jgi:16S rRNA processing protein RimM